MGDYDLFVPPPKISSFFPHGSFFRKKHLVSEPPSRGVMPKRSDFHPRLTDLYTSWITFIRTLPFHPNPLRSDPQSCGKPPWYVRPRFSTIVAFLFRYQIFVQNLHGLPFFLYRPLTFFFSLCLVRLACQLSFALSFLFDWNPTFQLFLSSTTSAPNLYYLWKPHDRVPPVF